MRHLISREDYIKEYLRISNQELLTNNNQIDSENELYEGLLGTLFGGLKMLFKRDWASIKCKNPNVLKHLQAIDKSLAGYTMVKMEFSNECQNIRQNIADYFNDILDYKLEQIEKEEDPDKFLEKENKEKEDSKEEGVAKKLNLKDETLLDSLDKYKSNINTACKPSPKLREYADQMLNSVEVFVNDIVLAELEKKGLEKAKLEEETKKNDERKKELKKIQDKMNAEAKKAGEDALKKISDERDNAMKNIGVKPIGAMDGDKSVDTIVKQFSDMLGEFNDAKLNESALPKGYSEIFRSDVYLGIQKSLEELNWNFSENEKDTPEGLYDKFFIKVILNKINTVFEIIAKNKDMFKDVPSASVQAMMVSLCNAVIYGFMGNDFDINDARLELMTKCAIDSDATVGFNLPLIDPKKPDNGNFFVSIMNQFKSADISSKEVEDAAKSLSEDNIKKISQVWNGKKDEDLEKDDSKNDEKSDKDEVAADPKNISEFAKEFGPLVMKDFRQNMTNLFDMIVTKAKQIKEDAKRAREAEATQAQQQSETNETSE
jgi:hypothetical protein